jgi:hypothetical protein
MVPLPLGVGVGVGVDKIFAPLPHTNFFPDLKQVYVYPNAMDVLPALIQTPPALTVALTGIEGRNRERVSTGKNATSFVFIE